MKLKNSDITLLCKVVDNYGDIGVVFRLAKALSELMPEQGAGLRLIVDNLAAFAQISPGVDVTKPLQQHRGWTVCQWDAADEGRKMYAETPPLVIVECFACGRPEWLDDILFDKSLQALRQKPVQIINLEYLTAEPYADEFHKLQSLTRSAQVRKVNFMPGFTDKTGGLILDGVPLTGDSSAVGDMSGMVPVAGRSENFPVVCSSGGETFTFLIFSYKRDFSTIADALAAFAENYENCAKTGTPAISTTGTPVDLSAPAAIGGTDATSPQNTAKIRILVAAGKSEEPFRSAWTMCADRKKPNGKQVEKNNKNQFGSADLPEPETLPFLAQEEWDKLLYSADFLFIRGEDSLSRACLSGKPFVWHAYPQSEMYHLVKVQALLDRMEPFFSAENFRLISDYWLWYNGKTDIGTDGASKIAADGAKKDAAGNTSSCNSNGGTNAASSQNATNCAYDSRAALLEILSHYDEIRESFLAFSKNLVKNGNLAEHLMTFIREIV